MEMSSLKNAGFNSYGMRAQTTVPLSKRRLGSNSSKRIDVTSPSFRFIAKSKAENTKHKRKIDRKSNSSLCITNHFALVFNRKVRLKRPENSISDNRASAYKSIIPGTQKHRIPDIQNGQSMLNHCV